MELTLSHSRRAVYRKCAKAYQLHYLRGVRRKGRPTYFAFGSAVHKGIQRWYDGLPTKGIAGKVFKEEIDYSRLDAQAQNDLGIEQAKAQGIIEGYQKFYASDLTRFKKHISESEDKVDLDVAAKHFEGTEFNKCTYMGYIDCLVQEESGDWWIKETKTTGDDIDDFLQLAKWNAQLCGYMVLAHRILGVWPRGVLYDIIKKTQIRQRTSKKPETLGMFQQRCYKLYSEQGAEKNLFRREQVLFNPRDIKIWKRQTIFEAEDILDSHRRKRFPMNYESCKGKYGVCNKLPICSTGRINKQLYDMKV